MSTKNIDIKIKNIEKDIQVLENLMSWYKFSINSTYGKIDFDLITQRQNNLEIYTKKIQRLKKYKQIFEKNEETNINT